MHDHHELDDRCDVCRNWPDWALEITIRLTTLETLMTEFATNQAHLDADVQAIAGIFSQLEAQIAQLKAAVAAGGPVDFTAADQLVADGQAFLNQPAAATTPSEPDVSNVPSDASTVTGTGIVAPPAPATDDVTTDTSTGTATATDVTDSGATVASGTDDGTATDA